MDIFYTICRAVSIGVIAGFIIGSVKFFSKKEYSEKRSQAKRKFINQLSAVLKYITFMLLTLGLVWCIYFLVLGAVDPLQAEYANNMSGLIVSILTVISVIFAFVEFLRRT